MGTAEENLETLSRAIFGEAREETEHLKTEEQLKADGIRNRAQLQADTERQEILARAAREAARLRSQAIATAQLKTRALELEHREKLLEQVFGAVRQELDDVPGRGDYEQVVVRLIREAVAQLKAGEVKVRADKRTQRLLTGTLLEQVSRDAHAQLSAGSTLEKGTGVVVEAADGHLQFDNTLETRLVRLQSALRSAVYHVLMGDAE
jgi:vacuolar-type H+-ATPase subunit E/Vma4